MAVHPHLIGQTLGHYRILEQIAAGGMGVVYRAHDEQLERDVAVKVLPVGTLADEAARKQFRKEALTLAKLNHPNIETVFDFATQDGLDFLVMELISGVSLKEKLKEGPLPEREVLRLGVQFAEGLSVAHEQGVIHRDLKPGNLMITTNGRLKILDFGLAKMSHPEPTGDITISKDIPNFEGYPNDLRDRPLHVAGTTTRRPVGRSQRHIRGWNCAVREGHRVPVLSPRAECGTDWSDFAPSAGPTVFDEDRRAARA